MTLLRRKKGPEDIKFVTNGGAWCTWNEFLLVATGPPPRLPSGTVKIVGNDWYLELVSSEFGTDYWVCREMPKLPAYHTPGALASNARLHSAA